jgi:hypothetical protein
MKFSIRFWTISVLLVSVLVACNRPAEQPSSSTAGQNQSGAAVAAQPANPEQPANTNASAKEPVSTPAETLSASSAPAKSAAQPAKDAKGTLATPPAAAPKPAAPPEVVSVPSGTTLTVIMIDPVGTDTSKPGDKFTASIGEPVVVNGKTVIAKGTKVQGRVDTVDEPGRVKGRAGLSLVLTQLIRRDKVYSIATEPFTAQAESGTKKDAAKVGGGAALGAIVGAIAGGGKGAAIGAGVGAGAGTGVVLATKGQQLRLESETKVNFVLKRDVDIVMTKSTT